ncbi:MAG TPA: hypothetical protein VGZ03_11580 [Acidimicrobiales bacterium]|nr:hypothetical protein [Acidimicrobiales bacterium]
MVVLAVAVVSLPAGAAVTNALPWPADDLFSPGALHPNGECALNYVVPGVLIDTSSSGIGGLRIQEACQGVVPSSGVDQLGVYPPAPRSGWQYWNVGASNWSGAGGNDVEPVSQGASGFGTAGGSVPTVESGSGSCTALDALIFHSAVDGSVYCVPQSSEEPGVWSFAPGGLTGGAECWDWVSQRVSQSVGAGYTGTDGYGYKAISFEELWTMNNEMSCFGNNAAAGKPLQELQDAALEVVNHTIDSNETACPFTGSMGPSGNNFDGVTYATADWWGDSFYTSSSSSTLASYSAHSPPWTSSGYEISAVSCTNTWTVGADVWFAQMPPTFATGGTAAGASRACSVVSTSLPAGDTNYQENKSYTFAVTLGGQPAATELVVDPADDPTENLSPGLPGDPSLGTVTSGSAVAADVRAGGAIFGRDAAVGHVSSSTGEASVAFSPTYGAGNLPQVFCVAGGVAYYLGNSIALGAGGQGAQYPPNAGSLCLDKTALDLFNPSTWVPAIASDVGCNLQTLFQPNWCQDYAPNTNFPVPPGGCFDSGAIPAAFTSHVPGAWITDAYNSVTTFSGGLSTAMTASACDAPNLGHPFASLSGIAGPRASTFTATLPVPASLGCSGAYSGSLGELFGYRVLFRDLEVVGIWLATVAIVWRMLPISRSGDGVELIGENVPGLGWTWFDRKTGAEVDQ